MENYIKMDFSLTSPEDRVKKVEEIILHTPPEKLTPFYLERLTNYLVVPADRKDRKRKEVLSDNHIKRINEREISFEGLVGKLENGEDGIYSLIANDKNIIFQHKDTISQEDAEGIPELSELQQAIEQLKAYKKDARGKRAFKLHGQLVEMYKDQYEIRDSFKPKIKLRKVNIVKSIPKLDLSENITIDEKGLPASDGIISLFNPDHISLLLCNYSKLKEESWDKFQSDIKWVMEDLDNLIELTFKDKYPLYYDLLIYKIDGRTNAEIQTLLNKDYDINHSIEYLSSLWRKKIPKMIAETAVNEYLTWYYTTQERGKWKKCSRCGEIKLAHNNFFSKNKTSKDGFYSICKCCRNKKGQK